MNTISLAFAEAVAMVVRLDPKLGEIVLLSLQVSLSSVAVASVFALPFGATVAVAEFPGKRAVVTTLNALLGLPAVVVGLAVYLLLSRSGPLGAFGILFTPSAMVVAQAILVFPLLAALTRQVVADAWGESRDQLQSLGAGAWTSALALLVDVRYTLVTIVLAGFGRAIAEVGAVMIVGGNIDGVTRVMTTAIALETSKGDLPLAVGLGIVLLAIVFALNIAATAVKDAALRRNITGRWNTMACRRGAPGPSATAQRTLPDVGAINPCITRSSTLFPAPLGPRTTVRTPRSSSRFTRSRIVRPRAANDTSSRTRGSSDEGGRLAMVSLGGVLDRRRGDVEREHDREQHDAEPHGERQVALRGLERDGGRHHAGEAVDVAADDHHRADLRDRAAERGEYDGDE